ncbi:phage repressor protein CI [Serratia bockelmannii]|jgi:phage repressor protein C with HTH and peptisase S24 domain|uniref:phage repressor protein CI n=1 Tax=Serratia bockelmannii TaxID=2703793 RepID=UPI00313E570B
MDFKTGGREVIERLIEAYGFTTRQALCDHLGVSKSTLATRYMRDIFPAEWVIQCALETGVSLSWLTCRAGKMYETPQNDIISIPRVKLIDGRTFDSDYYFFDKAFLPKKIINPIVIIDGEIAYIADKGFSEVSDGKWLLEIDGKESIKDIIRIPGKKIRVHDGKFHFDCDINDVTPLAEIKFIYMPL